MCYAQICLCATILTETYLVNTLIFSSMKSTNISVIVLPIFSRSHQNFDHYLLKESTPSYDIFGVPVPIQQYMIPPQRHCDAPLGSKRSGDRRVGLSVRYTWYDKYVLRITAHDPQFARSMHSNYSYESLNSHHKYITHIKVIVWTATQSVSRRLLHLTSWFFSCHISFPLCFPFTVPHCTKLQMIFAYSMRKLWLSTFLASEPKLWFRNVSQVFLFLPSMRNLQNNKHSTPHNNDSSELTLDFGAAIRKISPIISDNERGLLSSIFGVNSLFMFAKHGCSMWWYWIESVSVTNRLKFIAHLENNFTNDIISLPKQLWNER